MKAKWIKELEAKEAEIIGLKEIMTRELSVYQKELEFGVLAKRVLAKHLAEKQELTEKRVEDARDLIALAGNHIPTTSARHFRAVGR